MSDPEIMTRGWPCFRLIRDTVIDPAGFRVFVRGDLTVAQAPMADTDRETLGKVLEHLRARAELTTAQAGLTAAPPWRGVDAVHDRAAVDALARVLGA